jgi:putative ABC transport system substrate-binding protein
MSLSNRQTASIARRFFFLVAMVVAFAFGMHFWGVPVLLHIDKSFSYTADVLSLDNFFDEKSGKFKGESRSVTTFGYRFVREEEKGVIVKNFFDVRTVDGEKIVAIERNYGINPYSWAHQAGVGDKDRSGYLFAPRHLKKGEPFSYWHVNYDKEIKLVFEKEELINGLKTYRYKASFETDQTKDLLHLSGVPEEKGVSLDVSLAVWFEPVSGWLVKYEDSAIAYYYDRITGKRLSPWNKFSNRYRITSVEREAEHAKLEKAHIFVAEVLIPFLFFAAFSALILWKQGRKTAIGVFVAGGAILFGFTYVFFSFNTLLEKPVVVGISRFGNEGGREYADNIRGFKDALADAGYHEGKEIFYIEGSARTNVRQARRIAQVFLEKNVDMVYSLTTPGTMVMKEMISNRPVVFSIVPYPVESGLIASLKNSGNNLVGTRNWVPAEEQMAIFREMAPTMKTMGFVHNIGDANSGIQFDEVREAAKQSDVEVVDIGGNDSGSIVRALRVSPAHFDALYSACDISIEEDAEKAVIAFARERKVPAFSCSIEGIQKGNLLGVAADFYQIGKLAGEKAALILQGATPQSLETSTVARPFIYVNEAAARTLGFPIPQSILTKAKEIF